MKKEQLEEFIESIVDEYEVEDWEVMVNITIEDKRTSSCCPDECSWEASLCCWEESSS